jgi:peptide/nickel transport system permease protein
VGVYLARRLAWAAPLLLGVATGVFFLLHLAPGDAVSYYTGPGVSAQAQEQVRQNLGLDAPIPVRYVRWVGSMARGDFGMSLARNQPVRELVLQALPNTLILTGIALSLAFLVGVGVGVVQAVRHNTMTDRGLSLGALFFYSMPSFWLALMLILVFSLHARVTWGWPIWFPASGMISVDHAALSPLEQLGDRIRHLVLPSLSLALVQAAGVARYTRASMLEVIRQDFVRTARSRGLPTRTVILRHALRNALLPVITLLGLYLPFLFSGAVVIETVFAWPGMGKLMVDAIFQRDYPVVLAGSLLFTLAVVVGNLLADLLYAVADPRIRHRQAGHG